MYMGNVDLADVMPSVQQDTQIGILVRKTETRLRV